MAYAYLVLEVKDHIGYLRFNRPEKANALHAAAWAELESAFEYLDEAEEVRVVILSGEGKHFCSGIDISLLMSVTENVDQACGARSREKLRKQILQLQAPINAIERCNKPVIAAISGGCIGAGVDIVSACDLRYCSSDAYFSVREIDVGMVADLGTLQRLPKIIPDGFVREMAFTGRNVAAAEAERIGLVNKCFESTQALTAGADELAKTIASKSPVSVRGVKHILNHSRDCSVADGLAYVATWNAAMLISEDLQLAYQSKVARTEPKYRN
jgi:enoyl-CoA hydratase